MASHVSANGRTTPGLLQHQQPETEPPSTEPETPTGEETEEVVLEGEELFMTLSQEERDTWQRLMEEMEDDRKARKEKFGQWCDGISRRRMFAFSRMRKLQEGIRQRAEFYADVSAYISAVEAKAKIRRTGGGGSTSGVDAGGEVEKGAEANANVSSSMSSQDEKQESKQQQAEDKGRQLSTVTVRTVVHSRE